MGLHRFSKGFEDKLVKDFDTPPKSPHHSVNNFTISQHRDKHFQVSHCRVSCMSGDQFSNQETA